jgi:hypothetical protein
MSYYFDRRPYGGHTVPTVIVHRGLVRLPTLGGHGVPTLPDYYLPSMQLRRIAWGGHPLPNIIVKQKIGSFAKAWWARGAHPTRLSQNLVGTGYPPYPASQLGVD